MLLTDVSEEALSQRPLQPELDARIRRLQTALTLTALQSEQFAPPPQGAGDDEGAAAVAQMCAVDTVRRVLGRAQARCAALDP